MPTAATPMAELAARYSPAQRRTADAALVLFAEHGVGGTSLQMIADALGVTKAAVYHQFATKDAIVLAALEVQLAPVEAALHAAGDRDELLDGVVDVVVANRSSLSTLQRDPVLFRLLGEHPPSRHLWNEVFGVLLGPDADERSLVRASVLAALLAAVSFPLVVDLDGDVVRDELRRVIRRLLEPAG